MSRLQTFVVPYDFSVHADAALALAAELARPVGAGLHLVHVVQPPPPASEPAQLLEDAMKSLRSVADALEGVPGKLELHVFAGADVAETLKQAAAQLGADLIVMGSHGRTGLGRVALGSVAERTLRDAPCPVLTLRAATATKSSPKSGGTAMRAIALWCGFALLVAAPVARAATFTGIGMLPGAPGSFAAGVSADGSTVVGESGSVAFRWMASGGMQALADSQSTATAVSGDGAVVVGFSSGTSDEAFRWTESTGLVALGDLPGGATESDAYAISADGSTIVGWSYSSSGPEAFRWTASDGMLGLGGLPGEPVDSYAFGVSADGSVVVGEAFESGNRSVAFLWTEAAGMLELGALGGALLDSDARAVTPDGSIVVGQSATGADTSEAVRWTQPGGVVGLGNLSGGVDSLAHAISADGSRIVGWSYVNVGPGFQDQATIWIAGLGPRSLQDLLVADYGLDLTGWHLESAAGISADGNTIVGSGINPSGHPEAWIAVIPEPATGVLVALGLLGLAARRRLGV